MIAFQRLAGNIVVCFNALLIFFALFKDKIGTPAWLQSIGRVHPLLLHIPIGILIIIAILYYVRKRFKDVFLKDVIVLLLALGAITVSLTAIMGIVLSKEGGYADDTLFYHQFWGVVLSVLVAVAYFVYLKPSEPGFKFILPASVVSLLLAGHFGAILTHGNNFVLEPLFDSNSDQRVVTDSTTLFDAAVFPVLDKKCNSCHNDKKKKGQLSMASLASIAAGGEHGDLFESGKPMSSHLIKRILLPENNDDHMPPSGKPQLSAIEVQLLYQWILAGADTVKAWTNFPVADTLRKLAVMVMCENRSSERSQVYSFDAASPEVIKKLNDPYRTVEPIAQNEPALAATFYIQSQYSSERLRELSSVKDQLVELNLSKMPVSDKDCEIIAQFDKLEKLILNFTSITPAAIKTISSIKSLKSLAIAGTAIDATALEPLKELKDLKEVFIWNTSVKADDVAALQKDFSKVKWNTGFVPDPAERLRLTLPVRKSENFVLDKGETVTLVNKVPGTVIRYTLDGTEPDSTTSPIFDKPIGIQDITMIKARVCKEGWLCSGVASYLLFPKGIQPATASLVYQPNKDYRGEGVETLINNKKGFVEEQRDLAWTGFRENPLDATFVFNDNSTGRIVISYDRNPNGFIFPPARVEVWTGDDLAHLTRVVDMKPEQPSKSEPAHHDTIDIDLKGKGGKIIRIVATPVPVLPKWHPSNNPKTKDKRGWVFVDEIFFYSR